MLERNRLSKFFWWVYGEGGSSSDSSTNNPSSKDLKREKKLKHSKSTDELDKETDKQLNSENVKVVQVNNAVVHVEWFPSIPVLLNTVKLRKNNKCFGTSSHDTDLSTLNFTGTNSYEEAECLCLNGWEHPLKNLEVKVNDEMYKYAVSKKSNLRNTVAGYCPNVPNALMNLPNSMFIREYDRVENKVLHITYCMAVNYKTTTSQLINAGSKLLAAIKILELQHVSISLDLCFYSSINDEETEGIFNLLNVKNYGEQLDLLKLSFPLIHPSMFRRIGFASAETSSGPTTYFSRYGHAPSIYEHKEALNLDDNSIVLNVEYLENQTIENILRILKNGLDN